MPAIMRFAAVFLLLGLVGCYYLGMHGPSIRQFPDIHAGISEDAECLECHHPDHPVGPPTSHPEFVGCLKCHNDDIR